MDSSTMPTCSTDDSVQPDYSLTQMDASNEPAKRMSILEEAQEEEQKEYLASLEKEISEWDELAKQRKRALRHAQREAEKKPLVLTYERVEPYLTQEEKDFLAARPNYQSLEARSRAVAAAAEIVREETEEAMLRVDSATYAVLQDLEKVKEAVNAVEDPILHE